MARWMKIVIGLVLTLSLIVGLICFFLTEPNREINRNPFLKSISQQTNKYDIRVSLTPEPLTIGESYGEVETSLRTAGFSISNKKVPPTNWKPNKTEDGSRLIWLDENGEIIFLLNHGNFVCDSQYIVFLKFDESKKLLSAEGLIRGIACL